ncbi:hypothetical protein [Pararhizobium sp. PWRC1-1]|uniref:hypothetical protein n=1 Tax=Pararhizobium sp. PWRC1-1 TaxID=2804566 RepID=UPI003CEA63C3
MRAMVGKGIRRYMTGLYQDFIEDPAIVSSLKSGKLASIDFYSGAAMSVTSIPDGFVQFKRMRFQSEVRGVIRGDTHSILIPVAEATMSEGTIVHTWDTLSRRV